jgi:hypothetical protein
MISELGGVGRRPVTMNQDAAKVRKDHPPEVTMRKCRGIKVSGP